MLIVTDWIESSYGIGKSWCIEIISVFAASKASRVQNYVIAGLILSRFYKFHLQQLSNLNSLPVFVFKNPVVNVSVLKEAPTLDRGVG